MHQLSSLASGKGFSTRAWNLARIYVAFALLVLSLTSLVGAIKSYFDLFSAIN